MKGLLDKLKWFKTNLTEDNTSEFQQLLEEIRKVLPETYMMKLESLTFFEFVTDHNETDLPF